MDVKGVLLGFLLCGFNIGVKSQVTISSTNERLFPIGADATLYCLFNSPKSDLKNIVVAWWRSVQGTAAKIGKNFLNESRTFKYMDAPTNLEFGSARFSDGYSDLLITNIGISDATIYSCEVEDEVQLMTDNTDFTVEVFNIPSITIEDVEINFDITPQPQEETNYGNTMNTNDYYYGSTTDTPNYFEDEDGNVTIVRCNVVNCYPKPKSIKFYASEKSWEVMPDEFQDSTIINPDGTFDVIARLRITPIAELDKAVITCSAFITSENKKIDSENQSSPIEVLYLTSEVSLHISTSTTVAEFTMVLISCEANGNPAPTKTLLLPDGSTKDVSYTNYNVMADRSMAGKYKCTASNDGNANVFEDEDTLSVNWMDPPVIKGPSEARAGETVLLECSANSNHELHYTWKSRSGYILSQSYVLELNYLKDGDSGDYVCEAMGSTTMSATHTITVKTGCIPELNKKVSYAGVNKADVKIICFAHGNPACDMNLTPLLGFAPEISTNQIILEVPSIAKQEKPLKITCTASNEISSNNATVDLTEEEVCCVQPFIKKPSTIIIIVIAAGIVVVLVLVAVVVGCYVTRRKRSSKDITTKNELSLDNSEEDRLNAPAEETCD